jgi:hypothetical protein
MRDGRPRSGPARHERPTIDDAALAAAQHADRRACAPPFDLPQGIHAARY